VSYVRVREALLGAPQSPRSRRDNDVELVFSFSPCGGMAGVCVVTQLAALLVSARDPTSKASANMAEVKKTAEAFDAKSGYTVEASTDVRNDLIMKAMGSEAEKIGMKKGMSDKDIARQAAQAMEQKAALQTDSSKRESKARLVDVTDDHGKTHKVRACAVCCVLWVGVRASENGGAARWCGGDDTR